MSHLLTPPHTILILMLVLSLFIGTAHAQDQGGELGTEFECSLGGLQTCVCAHLEGAFDRGLVWVLSGGGGDLSTYTVPFNDVCKTEHGIEPGGVTDYLLLPVEVPILAIHVTCMLGAGAAGSAWEGLCWIGGQFTTDEEVLAAEARADQAWEEAFMKSLNNIDFSTEGQYF